MTFVNEIIPDVDKADIGEVVSPMTWQLVSLYKWTVDRDKKAYLIITGQDRDDPEKICFLLSLNRYRYDIRVKERITLNPGGESYVFRLDSIFGDSGLVPRSDVKEILKEALSVFAGFYGTVKPIAVEFEF